jgi:hypothetical protein
MDSGKFVRGRRCQADHRAVPCPRASMPHKPSSAPLTAVPKFAGGVGRGQVSRATPSMQAWSQAVVGDPKWWGCGRLGLPWRVSTGRWMQGDGKGLVEGSTRYLVPERACETPRVGTVGAGGGGALTQTWVGALSLRSKACVAIAASAGASRLCTRARCRAACSAHYCALPHCHREP